MNVVAGGGSFLTLPVMIFLGLPPTVANGTNRIAILMQNAGAVWSFGRHRLIARRWLRVAALPALIGAGAGTGLAVVIGDEAFQRVLALLMVVAALATLWRPSHPEEEVASGEDRGELAGEGARSPLVLGVCFFAIGVYGGFIQAGTGFLLIAVGSLAGLGLVRANALKVLTILVFTPLALAIFAVNGKVEWVPGLVLGAGNLLGGLAGVRFTVSVDERWIRRVVTVAILGFAVALWLRG